MLCVQSWHGGLFLILQALVLSTFSDRPSPAAIFLYLPNSITFSCFVESIALLTICSHIFGRLISRIQQIFIGYLLCAVWYTVENTTRSFCLPSLPWGEGPHLFFPITVPQSLSWYLAYSRWSMVVTEQVNDGNCVCSYLHLPQEPETVPRL